MDRVRVKKKTLQAVLEQCQRALEMLAEADGADVDGDARDGDAAEGSCSGSASSRPGNEEADEVCLL